MKAITLVLILMSWIAGAQSKFETGMQKALALWGENKTNEASALFERIAAAEPDQWLPNYYLAMVNATASFQTQDKEAVSAFLTRAQQAVDAEMAKDDKNPELYVVQALVYTAWIVSDPMVHAMVYSPKAMEAYQKAEILAPDNPRVVFGKAEFEMGTARYFGKDVKPMCDQVERAIALFRTEKPQTPLHPNWGLDRALTVQQECKK